MTRRSNMFYYCEKWWEKCRIKTVHLLLIYTLLFAAIMLVAFSQFTAAGKSLVQHGNDAVAQMCPMISYTGRYFRSLLKNFLTGEFSIPLFDFRLGLGDDVPAVLAWHGLFYPVFVFVSVLTPARYAEQGFQILVLLQWYLAGLSFIAYCRYMGKQRIAALCGALTYMFCGFLAYYATRHLLFEIPMIFMPLLLIGLEKTLCKGRPYFLIFMVFLSFISSYYFTFDMTIIMVAYAFLRFFELYSQDRWKNFWNIFFRSAGAYITGALLACFVFVPAVVLYLTNDRTDISVTTTNLLFYPVMSALKNLVYFFAPSGSLRASGSIMPMCFIAAVGLFFIKKKLLTLKVAICFAVIGNLVPLVGYIFNGGGYVADRWSFIVPLIFGYCLAEMFPLLQDMPKLIRKVCIWSPIVYCVVLWALLVYFKMKFDLYMGVGIVFMLSGCLLLTACTKPWHRTKNAIVILAVSFGFSCLNLYLFFSPLYLNYASSLTGEPNTAVSRLNSTAALSVDQMKDGGFYRTDATIGNYVNSNAFIQTKYPGAGYGLSEYWSLLNSRVTKTQLNMENAPGARHIWSINGFDQRASLTTLASVKYFASLKSQEAYAPYGFTKKFEESRDGKEYTVFENPFALSLGYTYNQYIDEQTYRKLSALERQETVMQAVVLDTPVQIIPEADNLIFTSEEVPYKISMTGCTWEDGILTVNQAGAVMTLVFPGNDQEEMYLRFHQLKNTKSYFSCAVKQGDVSKAFSVFTPFDSMYSNVNDYMVQLGRTKDAVNCTITWPLKGTFELGGLSVYRQPMEEYEKQMSKLLNDMLEDVQVGVNSVSGHIMLKQDKILCLSIPYSTGWKAAVNGRQVDVLRANEMYMALPLKAGNNEITLTYITPGLTVGLIFSGIGIIILVGLVLGDRLKKKIA